MFPAGKISEDIGNLPKPAGKYLQKSKITFQGGCCECRHQENQSKQHLRTFRRIHEVMAKTSLKPVRTAFICSA